MIPDLFTHCEEPVLLVPTSLFDPEHKDLDIGEQSRLSVEQAGQAMAVANISKGAVLRRQQRFNSEIAISWKKVMKYP